jgi:hypothetical protein
MVLKNLHVDVATVANVDWVIESTLKVKFSAKELAKILSKYKPA